MLVFQFRTVIRKNPGLGFSIAGGQGSRGVNPFRTGDTVSHNGVFLNGEENSNQFLTGMSTQLGQPVRTFTHSLKVKHTSIHTHTANYIHTLENTYTHLNTCTHTHTHSHTHTHTHQNKNMYPYTYTPNHNHSPGNTHTHTHISFHPPTPMNTHPPNHNHTLEHTSTWKHTFTSLLI